MPGFDTLPQAVLRDMAAGGEQVLECYRVLRKGDSNVVGELLRGAGTFYEWDHYPKGDVYDHETHAQYYYHAHPAETRADIYGPEHGHFHTFLRPRGMPAGVRPLDLPDYVPPEGDNDALSHLVAISMDRAGYPIRLFTTNRWVTGESWYGARDVIRLLDQFHMDLAYPSRPVNIWISAMLRLFRPQVEELLCRRDAAVADWQARHPDRNAYEDRELEITSCRAIAVEEQVRAVRAALSPGRR